MKNLPREDSPFMKTLIASSEISAQVAEEAGLTEEEVRPEYLFTRLLGMTDTAQALNKVMHDAWEDGNIPLVTRALSVLNRIHVDMAASYQSIIMSHSALSLIDWDPEADPPLKAQSALQASEWGAKDQHLSYLVAEELRDMGWENPYVAMGGGVAPPEPEPAELTDDELNEFLNSLEEETDD